MQAAAGASEATTAVHGGGAETTPRNVDATQEPELDHDLSFFSKTVMFGMVANASVNANAPSTASAPADASSN